MFSVSLKWFIHRPGSRGCLVKRHQALSTIFSHRLDPAKNSGYGSCYNTCSREAVRIPDTATVLLYNRIRRLAATRSNSRTFLSLYDTSIDLGVSDTIHFDTLRIFVQSYSRSKTVHLPSALLTLTPPIAWLKRVSWGGPFYTNSYTITTQEYG